MTEINYRTGAVLGTIETVITGRQHFATRLEPGEAVAFTREPMNAKDPNAVRVSNLQGVQVGYLPRRIVKWLASLHDTRMVELEGEATASRRVRHGLTPLDLRVRLTPRGQGILHRRRNPASVAEAFHEMVLSTWNMTQHWARPEVIRNMHELLVTSRQLDALPETQLLLALFPGQATRADAQRMNFDGARVRSALRGVRVGDGMSHGGLTVFPLFSPNGHEPVYMLLEEALATGAAEVREVSEGGSVPELLVVNRGGTPILIPEGEVLTGEKQNRTVNVTVMVESHTELVIPVSCVEAGRWSRMRQGFASSHYAPPDLRASKNRSVNRARMERREARSDQGRVWDDVACSLNEHAIHSPTSSLTEGMDRTRVGREDYRRAIQLPDGATGAVFALDGKVVGVDLFDAHATMTKLWPRLSDAYFFHASMRGTARLTPEADGGRPDLDLARDFLEELPRWTRPADVSVGAGTEFLIDGPEASGNALTYQDRLCHLAACVAS